MGYMADPGGEGPIVEQGRMSVIRMGGAANGYGNVNAHEASLTMSDRLRWRFVNRCGSDEPRETWYDRS